MNDKRDLVKGFLVSGGFHILLLAISLLITVRLVPEVTEYAELSLARLTTALPVQPPRPKGTSPPPERGAKPEQPSTPVELPKLRAMEEKEPAQMPSSEKLGPKEGAEVVQRPGLGQKESLETTFGDEEKGGPSELPGEREGPQFTIEGPAAGRTIVSKVLPKYPPGHQKEIVVRVRLTVLPNGLVGELIPLQKGDPTLEELTVKALSQWRFSPLPPDLPQLPQEGRITFIYRLK